MVGLALLACTACDFDSSLAPRTELGVVVDAQDILDHDTDLGYRVELTRARAAVETLEFTTDGEMHARASVPALETLYDWVIPTAYAHPGHAAGGEVVGELPGRFVFDWSDDGALLGVATMLEATYSGANFAFAIAESGDGLSSDDPIIGHTFDLAGVASRDGRSVTFEVLLDQDEGRAVIGLPLDLEVTSNTDVTIGLSFYVTDPVESKTIFDGVDFFELDDNRDGHVELTPDSEAWSRVRRNLQVHDHYGVEVFE